MEVLINKQVIETFQKFWSDPYFTEFLSVNAPDYTTAALIIQACDDLTRKLIDKLNAEN
ncbi:hypothetical protein J6T66_03075 [bacterium]|nr:hypothetical protein [bacterium]